MWSFITEFLNNTRVEIDFGNFITQSQVAEIDVTTHALCQVSNYWLDTT